MFELTPNGDETVLLDFFQQGASTPYGGMVLDPEGNLYGTTFSGGIGGWGTVFELPPNGQEITMHSFAGYTVTPPDGENPAAGLVRDAAGNLYGTTSSGGDCPLFACGILFEIGPTGQETILHQFGVNPGDGKYPSAGLLLIGNILYGTTYMGGASGMGTVFSFDLSSGTETVLYSFAGGTDGEYPSYGALVQDSEGNLYGTTIDGGSAYVYGSGAVYKVNPATGAESVLYGFQGRPDGANPYGGVVLDSQGNLYGTAYRGGYGACSFGQGCGTVFELSATGQFTVLHSFNGSDGEQPWSSLAIDAGGNLYGTTNAGGTGGLGNVFKLSPP